MLVHAASEKQQSSRNRKALPPRQTRFSHSFQTELALSVAPKLQKCRFRLNFKENGQDSSLGNQSLASIASTEVVGSQRFRIA